MRDELVISLNIPRNLAAPTELAKVLQLLESEPLATPTHASLDERKRLPYNRDEATAAGAGRALSLWRSRKPKYTDGVLTAANVTHNALGISYQKGLSTVDQSEIFATWTRLVDALKPEFGLIHPVFVGVPEAKHYNPGYQVGFKAIRDNGFDSFHARNWFGPDLVGVIGRQRLLSLPRTSPLSWGGVQLDLLEDPWEAEVGPLLARQTELKEIFKSWGLLGDHSVVGRPRPGPNWTPRTWGIP